MTAYDHEPTPAERGDYWVAVHTWIFQVEGLTRTALDTYIGLASYADRAGVAWPSVQAVADRMRMSASSVRRGITELESLGILTRVPAYIEGRQVSNRYQIRMTAPEPLAPARPIDDGRGGTVWQIDDDTDTPPNHDDRGGCQDDRGGCQPDTPGLSRGQGGGVTLTDRTPPENTTREHHQGTSGRAGARDTPAAVTGTESKPAKRGTRIPTRFTITDEMIQWAVEHVPGLDVAAETERFIDYWLAVPGSRGIKLDWTATWRNWMRRSHDSGRGPRLNQKINMPTDESSWDRVTQELFTPTAYRDVMMGADS